MYSVSSLQTRNLKCISHLQLIMTWNGTEPGASVKTMSGDCCGKWTWLVPSASKPLCSIFTFHTASWQLAREVIIIFSALCLHLRWKQWVASFVWKRGFPGVDGCVTHAPPGARGPCWRLHSTCSVELWACSCGAGGPGSLSWGFPPVLWPGLPWRWVSGCGKSLCNTWGWRGSMGDYSSQTQMKVHRDGKRYIFLIQMYVWSQNPDLSSL